MNWLDSANDDNLFLSVLTIGELSKGIELRRKTDPTAAAALEHWLKGINLLFFDHIIGADSEVANAWGRINAKRPYPVIDSLLVATAQVHAMTLVTRNTKDIKDTGILYFNPWTDEIK